MSSIRYALEKLDYAIGQLDESLFEMEIEAQNKPQPTNVIDVDFMALRLDKAIQTVENILRREG